MEFQDEYNGKKNILRFVASHYAQLATIVTRTPCERILFRLCLQRFWARAIFDLRLLFFKREAALDTLLFVFLSMH